VLAQARASAARTWALDSTAVESRHLRVADLIWAGDPDSRDFGVA